MEKRILFENVWLDDDMVELKIAISDGEVVFANTVYVAYQHMTALINDLTIFKDRIYGGLYDIQLGEFGQEYANGAFFARLHFDTKHHGHIFISIRMQTEFFDFGIKKVAKEANLYMITEPALLDKFILQLRKIAEGVGNLALLECI